MSRKTYIDRKKRRRFKDSNKSFSRWKVEKKLGGKIFPGYEVHHIDGNSLNDDINNLTVISRKKHDDIHPFRKKFRSV